MQKLYPSLLSTYLSQIASKQVGLEKIKTVYRPYICPFHKLLPLLPKDETPFSLFDIGCGGGVFLSLVSRFSSVNKLSGIDIDPKAIEKAKAFVNPEAAIFSVEVYDGKEIPDAISEYDYITMIDVLHHVPISQKKEIIGNIFSKMKKNACFIFKDIDANSKFLVNFNKLHDYVLTGSAGSEISLSATIALFEEVGFSIQEVQSERMLFYPHFIIVAIKR